jgi:hypothetical protein
MRKNYQIILLTIIVFTTRSCLQKESCIEHDYKMFGLINVNGEDNDLIFKCENCELKIL